VQRGAGAGARREYARFASRPTMASSHGATSMRSTPPWPGGGRTDRLGGCGNLNALWETTTMDKVNEPRTAAELTDGSARSPSVSASQLFSIGHSNMPLAAFLGLLHFHRMEVVADVRSYPRSQLVPHFDSKPLQQSLTSNGIQYVFLGRELGGRPDGDQFYDEADYVLYDRVARSEQFARGIQRLLRGAAQFRVAMLCSEEDPARCHRHLLISRVLADRGVDVAHIRRSGEVQTEAALANVERRATGPIQPLLFQVSAKEQPWKSLQSVSRKRAQRNSSAR
jgi:hypothetical protein